jgi:16S rRNA (cytidine1402-2'-O)-methyltransferase
MASGMTGQQFQFAGYLPVKDSEKSKRSKNWKPNLNEKNCTQIFIETPYRKQPANRNHIQKLQNI